MEEIMAEKEAEAAAVVLAANAVAREDADNTSVIASAEKLTITTVEQMAASSALLTSIKGRQKSLTELRLSITKPMDAAKKGVMEVFQPAVDRLANAERTLKSAVLTYTQEQEQKRREEQARLDAAAEREREQLRKQAELQRQAGHEERAAASDQLADVVQAPPVETPPVASGAVHIRTTWRAEVVDLAALAKACGEGQQQIGLIQANMTVLNAMARTLKESLAVPGVKAIAEQGISARSDG